MPTYEYECQACHERVEAVQRFSDPALSICPLCGGDLRKVFSAVGIVFKGSGFYKNDSRGASSSTTPSTSSSKGDSSPTSSSAPSPTPSPTPSTPAASTPAASTSSSSD